MERTPSQNAVFWLVVAVLLSILAVLYVQLPALLDPYRIDDDLRQHFWMARFQDSEVFPGDFIFYEIKRVHIINILGVDLVCQFDNLGFSSMYQLASYLITPLTFNKILPFILMVICVVYLFALGRLFKLDNVSAFFLTILFVMYSLSTSANISLTSGLERSFQFVLLIVFMYYLVSDSPIGIVVTLVVQVLFYAPMFVISVMVYVLSLFYRQNRRVKINLSARRIWPLIIGVALATMVLLPAVFDPQVATASLSDKDGQMPVWQNPNYHPGGRVPIFPASFSGFPSFLVAGYGGLARVDDLVFMVPLWLLTLMILVLLGFERSCPSWRVNSLLAGSLLGWLLSWLVALMTGYFVLRYPFKYTNAPLPLWMLLYCSLNSEPFLKTCIRVWSSPKGRWGLLFSTFGVLALIYGLLIGNLQISVLVRAFGALTFVIGVSLLMLWRGSSPQELFSTCSGKQLKTAWCIYVVVLLVVFVPWMRSHTMTVPQEERPLLEHVSTLPKDVLVAGAPEITSNIPLFSKRGVLFSSEISYVGGTKVVDFFDAYYAESADRVLTFCQQYGVDYLVVDERGFYPDYLANGRFFYSPFNESIAPIVAARSNFVLPQIPDSHKAFQSGPLFVVACTADALQ